MLNINDMNDHATLDPQQQPLFIGIYPGGIIYADRRHDDPATRDYKRIAFLDYGTLHLSINDPDSDLLPAVKADAATYKAGARLQVSTAGQYITLGTAQEACTC